MSSRNFRFFHKIFIKRKEMFLRLSFRKFTTAKILPIQSVFLGKRNRAVISALLLKIGKQVIHAVPVPHLFPDFIQPLRVFIRAERQGRCKPFKAKPLCRFRRLFKAQTVTLITPRTALRLVFQTLCHLQKRLRVVVAIEKLRPARFLQKPNLLRLSLCILFFVVDIRIIV